MTKKQRELNNDIAKQGLASIEFNRTHKAGKISNWQKNEALYYQKKQANTDNRANVNLGRMQEFVHSLWSKIDNPLMFKFVKRKESQLKRVNLLNALVSVDSNEDYWDIKDLVGKKQGIIYGRSVFNYYADSVDGYKAHLENIDVYDFLVDPNAGGIDIEKGNNCGDYSVVLSKTELTKGVKDGLYDSKQVEELISGNGNADESTTEEENKNSRTISTGIAKRETKNNPDLFKFWRWYETFEGVRYYVLMTNNGHWIRCEVLEDVFPSGLYPYWTWACFPDLTEFWTPSFCDYAREIFMAQDVSINQMLDNAEAINRPMKVVNVGAIEDLAQLKYRRDGNIITKGDYDANKAIQVINTPSINTPIEVFNILEGIQEKASGVTAGAKGVSDEQGKVGIYEGNQAAAADRFGLLNKSYSFGYKRFAKLYEDGVKTHLNKKVAVDILGTNGVEVTNVNKRDLFKKGDKYSILVDSSNAEATTSIQDQTIKNNFLATQAMNPKVNQEKLFELQAKIAGFEEDDIKELLDTSAFGNQELMSEAERDIESLLNGDTIKPNKNANNAYRQRILDFMNDHEEDIDFKQFQVLSAYFMSLEPFVMRNEARQFNNMQNQQLLNNPMGLDQNGQPVQPTQPVQPQINAQI
jgi:hypothetical protein